MLGDWFMADIMQYQCPQHLRGLHKTAQDPPDQLCLCCFLVKEHTHREAGVYRFFLVTAVDRLRIQFYARLWQATDNKEIITTSEELF